MPPLFPATLALYAVAATLYLAHLTTTRAGQPAHPGEPLARVGRIVLGLAFVSHAIDIGWLGVHGLHPGSNAREAISFAGWLTCGIYLAVSFRHRIPVVGALVVPATLVLDVAARLSPHAAAVRPGGSVLGAVHVTLALAGLALFLVAAGGSAVYLTVERRLKQRRGHLAKGGPSLQSLDALNWRCIAIGFPLYTVAMVTGALWAVRIPGLGVFTPQYAIAALAWLLYAGLLLGRATAGLRGRRAALVTLAGAITATTVLLIYFVRGVQGV